MKRKSIHKYLIAPNLFLKKYKVKLLKNNLVHSSNITKFHNEMKYVFIPIFFYNIFVLRYYDIPMYATLYDTLFYRIATVQSFFLVGTWKKSLIQP